MTNWDSVLSALRGKGSARRRHLLIACLAMFPLVGGCSEDTARPSKPVALRSGVVRPVGADSLPTATRHFVARLNTGATTATLRALSEAGAHVEAIVDTHGVIVTLDPEALGALEPSSKTERALVLPELSEAMDWLTPLRPEHKLSPVFEKLREGRADPGDGPETATLVAIDLFGDANAEDVSAALRAQGITVLGASIAEKRVLLSMSRAEIRENLDEIAEHNDVLWIGTRGKRVLLNDTSVWVGQSGLAGSMAKPIHDHGILGQGQIGAVLDSGADVDHCMFLDPAGLPATNQGWEGKAVDPTRRKVIAYNFMYSGDMASDTAAWDNHGHGTHVCGTVLGDGGTPGMHDGSDGMAPLAKLVMQDGGFTTGDDCSEMAGLGCPVVDLKPIFQQAYDQGARVHNNSWGDREQFPDQDLYSQACVDVDEFVWNHRDFLLVFAAGNTGPSASTIGSPSVSKNCLSVGATARSTGANKLASFSSRGPSRDGRFKPDVTFPGQGIQSASNDGDITTNNCSNRSMSGTSMASPGASGMALLVRQYFTDGFYPSGAATPQNGFAPSAALMKAAMINSATAMDETAIPSMDQGWGRIQLDRTLIFAPSTFELFVQNEGPAFNAPTDPPQEFLFNVLTADHPFKATLVWTDYPSTTAASKNLVNDLDLRVTTPAGDYLGNVFMGGASTMGGTADSMNNVEQVLLPMAPVGMLKVTVSATAVAMGPQPFALVVTGPFAPNDGGAGGTGGAGTGGSAGSSGVGGAGAGGVGASSGVGGGGAGGIAGGTGGQGGLGGTAGLGGAGGLGGTAGDGSAGTSGAGGAGAGGVAGTSGAGGVGATAGTSGVGGTYPTATGDEKAGCACRSAGASRRMPFGHSAMLLLASVGLAARRRSRHSCRP